jgi:hypothetical protein
LRQIKSTKSFIRAMRTVELWAEVGDGIRR